MSASVEHVLAAGQSQSALRLRDYLDQWLPAHPNAVGLIDGVLVHGDVFAPKPFANPLSVKVLHLLSDLEAADDGFDPATHQPDRYRLWEVAGTGHSDYWIGHQSVAGHGPRVVALAPKQTEAQHAATRLAAGNYGERIEPELLVCTVAGIGDADALRREQRRPPARPLGARGPGARQRPALRVRRRRARQGRRRQHARAASGYRRSTSRWRATSPPPASSVASRSRSPISSWPTATAPMPSTTSGWPTATDAAVSGGWMLPPDAIDLMARACAAKVRFPDADHACPAYTPPAYDVSPAAAAPPVDAAPTPLPRDHAAAGGGTLPATGREPATAAAGMALLLGFVLRAAPRQAG